MISTIFLVGLGILVFAVVIVAIVVCMKTTNGSTVEGQNQSVTSGVLGSLFGAAGGVSKQPTSKQSAEEFKIYNTKEYVPVRNINGFVCDLGNHQYRAAIECASINRSLKTAEENQMIDALFQQFVNSVKFPLRFYIQTREIDNSRVIERLEKDIQNNVGKLPALEEYEAQYLEGMKNLALYVGNAKQKKKYIIVSYDDAWKMDSLSDAEKEEFAVSELRNRAYMVKEGIEAVGITARILESTELYEVLYACYHRNSYSVAEGIANGNYTSLMAEADTYRLEDKTYGQLADVYLQGLINQFTAIVNTKINMSDKDLERYQRVLQILTNLQTRVPNLQPEDDLMDIVMASEEEAEILASFFEGQEQKGDQNE